MRTTTVLTIALIAAAALAAAPAAWAAPGDLDPSFGSGGIAQLPAPVAMAGEAVALQPDGKIVVAGISGFSPSQFLVARLLPDGSPDPAFGTGGQVVLGFAGDAAARDVAVTSDGEIVAAGSTGGQMLAVRLLGDGTPDSSFSGDGIAQVPFAGGTAQAGALALQPDGRIVLGGTYSTGGMTPEISFGLARLLDDGDPDSSFDGDGTVVTGFGVPAVDYALVNALAWTPAGIVAAGPVNNPFGGGGAFALARYTDVGALDPSFDGDGKVTNTFGGSSEAGANALAIDGQGRILPAGDIVPQPPVSNLALARYSTGGTLDPTFGTAGEVVTSVPGEDGQTGGVALDAIERIVVSGQVQETPSSSAFVVLRYGPDGAPDPTFGSGGIVLTQIVPGGSDAGAEVVIQPDGRIVVVGTSGPQSGNSTVAVVRYLAAPPPASTAPPVVSGAAVVGQPLACSTGSWAGDPTSFAYAWLRGGQAIPGATGTSYTPAPGDAGTAIACQVTATSFNGSASATSAAVTITSPTPPPPPPAPVLSGVTLTPACLVTGGATPRGAARNARLAFTLTAPATVTFTVQRRTNAPPARRRCPTPSPTRGAAVPYGSLGTFTGQGAAGANAFTLTPAPSVTAAASARGRRGRPARRTRPARLTVRRGRGRHAIALARIAGGGALAPGWYRVLVQATGAGGGQSAAVGVKLWVLVPAPARAQRVTARR